MLRVPVFFLEGTCEARQVCDIEQACGSGSHTFQQQAERRSVNRQ